LLGHLADQFPKLPGHAGPPSRSRLPSPEQLKTLPMPAEEGLGLDVDQGILPCKKPREQNHRYSSGVGRPSRLSLALQVEGQLFTEENIFRFEGSARTRPQQYELQSALGQIEKYRNQAKQGMSCSHGAGSMPPACWEGQLCVSCEFVTINSRCTDFLRSTAGEAYDAQDRGPNWKSRFKSAFNI